MQICDWLKWEKAYIDIVPDAVKKVRSRCSSLSEGLFTSFLRF